MSNSIQSVQLKGHKGSVLCVEHNSSVTNAGSDATTGCLLSGSEDHTARLWDLRSGLRAATCIIAGGEVASVAFSPSSVNAMPVQSSPFSRNFSVYLAVGHKVLEYDLRKADKPIIPFEANDIGKTILVAEDEINSVVLSDQRRNQPLHLAAADDTGVIQVSDYISSSQINNNRIRTLHHDKEHVSMVMAAAFRPHAKSLELASGGTDCQILLWDVNKPKKPVSSHKIKPDQTGTRNQLCNPPMVNSISWSPSGRLLAAGLGDGSASVFAIENRSLVEVARLQEHGHETPVASVIFPGFLPTSSEHIASQDRLFVTLRNDAVVNLWDLGHSIGGDGALNPSSSVLGVLSANMDAQEGEELYGLSKAVEDLSVFGDQPRLLFGIPHLRKPNCMASSRGRDPLFPSTLFVADTTNDITAYSIPL